MGQMGGGGGGGEGGWAIEGYHLFIRSMQTGRPCFFSLGLFGSAVKQQKSEVKKHIYYYKAKCIVKQIQNCYTKFSDPC